MSKDQERGVKKPLLAIVLPCYNEEEIILQSANVLKEFLTDLKLSGSIHPDSFIVIVDDGSSDKTLDLLISQADEALKVVKLASNVGHQNALLAGMQVVTGHVDCAITMDVDLQDDLSAISKMIAAYNRGAHIVYGVRNDRETDTVYKSTTARVFYKLMGAMGVKLIEDHADFRLLSGFALSEFAKYKEVNLFIRGIIPMIGLKSEIVYYKRLSRIGGDTKYSLIKMLSLALDGVTSFSNRPVRLISFLGIFMFVTSVFLAIWIVLVVLRGDNIPGWASTALVMDMLGGIQLLALGIMGEYISKIYLETKGRPHYHIEAVIEKKDQE
ncbi:glycosyltransferase family 2 protein [Arcticibacter tournemirensis]|uniref:Glycosyltransferase family 2 protein n=1 Tax=Arcticibacter tournemirensis TaxID=699437 RepID=A0A5M9HCH4_9SPHI|nr:glycosyltransferase family 2 protein [Arcticibacter tournemirensis]KAA8484622.1 glycosyltransferase family 2 protein [Arcticibacter tournemirensis]